MWWKFERQPKIFARAPGEFDHTINLHTLPTIEEVDDYDSYCFFDWDHPILYYDNDEPACICGREDCDGLPGIEDPEALDVNPYEHRWCECGTMDCTKKGKRHRPHRPTTLAVCFFRGPIDRHLEYTTLIHEELVVFPDSFSPPVIERQSKLGGWLYAVATQPDLSLHRIKFGFSRNMEARLKAYQTPCPRSLLLGAWEADESEERALFTHLNEHGYRFAESEEFDLRDPFKTLAEIPAFLSRKREQHRRYEMSRDAESFSK